jgi:hypothetical protein
VPAKDVGIELGAKDLRPDIFERAGLAVAAMLNGEPSVRRREHMLRHGGDRVRLFIVGVKTLDPNLILQACDVFGFPRRGEPREPRTFRVSAAQSPVPDEQPVMRIDPLGLRSTVNGRLSRFPQAEGPSA